MIGSRPARYPVQGCKAGAMGWERTNDATGDVWYVHNVIVLKPAGSAETETLRLLDERGF